MYVSDTLALFMSTVSKLYKVLEASGLTFELQTVKVATEPAQLRTSVAKRLGSGLS